MVNAVPLHLAENLHRVGESFGHVGKDLVHLLPRLKPLLLAVEHALGIIEVSSCREAEQTVVSLSVVLVDEV